jgi:hypothetical protein
VQLAVRWFLVKNVPNSALRHVRLGHTTGRAITHGRDMQEPVPAAGWQALEIMRDYTATTSVLDNWQAYAGL